MSVLWDSYAKTTAHLSMIEHGAYRLLLDHYIQNGSKIKADEKQLLRICRAFAKEEKEALLSVLAEFFELSDGHYIHAVADEAIATRQKIAEVRARAGAIGGAKRKAKPEANIEANEKHLLGTSLSSSLRQKKEKARGRAAAPGQAAAPPAALEGLVDSRWEENYLKWAKIRAMFGEEVWLKTFADCRPNGSETTLIVQSQFRLERLETQFADKLEKVFGEPVRFKLQEETKP